MTNNASTLDRINLALIPLIALVAFCGCRAEFSRSQVYPVTNAQPQLPAWVTNAPTIVVSCDHCGGLFLPNSVREVIREDHAFKLGRGTFFTNRYCVDHAPKWDKVLVDSIGRETRLIKNPTYAAVDEKGERLDKCKLPHECTKPHYEYQMRQNKWGIITNLLIPDLLIVTNTDSIINSHIK
jgi:hypothetical protein